VPKLNAVDLDDIPEEIRGEMELLLLDDIQEVLAQSLEPVPEPLEAAA
jgi:ATP-dependent Lon protease